MMVEIRANLPKKTKRQISKAVKNGKKIAREIREAEHRELRKAADEFLNVMTEVVDHYVFVHDVEGLGRLVTQVHIVQDHALLQVLRDKGMSEEITALCDKAGARL